MHLATNLKKFFFLFALLVGFVTTVHAQIPYGNEWINYEQTYHKIKVTQTGLHRLSYGYLDSLGLSTVNPQNLQLFRRGKEVAIHIAGEQDGRLDPQDFMEFYGERNDGALDTELYKNPSHQYHKFFSLYTDTAAYFLTFSAIKGKRMQEKNISGAGMTPDAYYIRKALLLRTNWYFPGKLHSLIYTMPWMDEGEGFVSDRTIATRNYEVTGVTNVHNSGPLPYVEYATVGAYQEYHKLDVNVVGQNGTVRNLGKYEYDFFSGAKDKKPLNFSDITTDGKVILQVAPVPSATRGNAISFSFGQVTFPQKVGLTENHLIFYTDSLKAGNYYYEFANAGASTVAYDVTDQSNIIRIVGNNAAAGKGFLLEASTATRKILVADTNKPFKPTRREKNIRFRKIVPDAHNYIIVTNKRLMKKLAGSQLRAPEQFAAYRASQAGGGYDTLLTHMDQIVDQFHYGEYSSNAVRRFMKFMASGPRTKHLFIIGKGVKYASAEYRSSYGNRFSYYHVGGRLATIHEVDLVPTGISPSSDVFFTADFQNDSFAPATPTGRLAVTKPEEIMNYLNKVKEYEALPEGLAWRKNILQLGGGVTNEEIVRHGNYLRTLKNIAEGPLLGANVIEKYRQNVSEVTESINVVNEVNTGVSLITFFGHSSTSTTDLDIGYVSSPMNGYNNKSKYPVILMNGCGSGDAFIHNFKSFGEDWMNTPDKGAIAFISHSDAGYPPALFNYSSNFYSTAFSDPDYYGKTIGQVQQRAINKLLQNRSDVITIATAMEMVLQGDPAVKIYNPSKPDYVAVQNGVRVTSTVAGEVVTAASDEFNIVLDIQNLGKAITDSVVVSVKRTLADKTVLESQIIKVTPVFFKEQVVLKIDNRGITALGMNSFEITVDGDFKVDELDETNNTARFQHFFPANGLVVVFPYKYSIVSSKNVKIVAQTTQLEESRKGYYLEVDTTHHFNSKLKKTFTTENALVATWDVDLSTLGNLPDSTVYYWRARFQNYEVGEDTLYASSSFRVINGAKPGWSQSHIGQFSSIETNKINLTEAKPHFTFITGIADVSIKTRGGDLRYTNPPYGIFLNDKHLLGVPCDYPESSTLSRIYMVVINDKTLELVRGLPFAVSCLGTEYDYLYQFRDMNNATVRANMEAFLKQVPQGYYVAVVSINKVPFESFTASQKDAFKSIGAGLIDNLKNGYPYALLGRKGAAPGSVHESTAIVGEAVVPTQQEVALRVTLKSNQQNGELTSPIIGPALSWGTLHHNIEKYKAGNDDYTLRVIGINSNGSATVLANDVTTKSFNLSNIDAATYPYLQLQASLSDATDRSAPQLDQWLVFYEAPPEGVIRPDLVQVSEAILTEQANKGKITLPMAFQNITSFAFRDSVAVDITVTGDGLQQPIQKRIKVAPLAGNATMNFSYELNTLALDGNYKVSIYINPRLQPEQNYFNNIYVVPFKVKSKLHPIMDVAFDGVHIMDGELISPSPLISVTVKDENRQAFLEDVSNITVVMVDPDGNPQELALDKTSELLEHVEVYPATNKSDFRVEFKPSKLKDGVYKMEIRAKDVAGRQSGISPYSINFEVENRSTITNFYPFPNPFSTKTNFIFTLTGATIPDHIKIQILTITGKVVKEIMKEELGPLRIGNNKTEYAWDGTDMYGDKLANGVYLYRVVVSQGAEEMHHKQKYGDKAFKNGYGKLYILR